LLCLNARARPENLDRRGHAGISAAIVSGAAELVSGAAELHQVKKPCETIVSVEQNAQKKKKPGSAGLFDEYLFQSVHFASLAI
jgi:hypothetical protein